MNISNVSGNNIIQVFSIQQGPNPRVTEIPPTQPLKRTADVELAGHPDKKQRTDVVHVVPVSVELASDQIISICEQRIEEADYNAARTIIKNNTVLSDQEKASLCLKLSVALLNQEKYIESNEVVFEIGLTLNISRNERAELLNKLVFAYTKLNDYIKAKDIIEEQALPLAEDVNLIGKLYNNLSSVYYELKDFDKALEAAQKGLMLPSLSDQVREALWPNNAAAAQKLLEERRSINVQRIVSPVIPSEPCDFANKVDASQLITNCKGYLNEHRYIDAEKAASTGIALNYILRKQKIKLYYLWFEAVFALEDFIKAEDIARTALAFCGKKQIADVNVRGELYIRIARALLKQTTMGWADVEPSIKKVFSLSGVRDEIKCKLYMYLSEASLLRAKHKVSQGLFDEANDSLKKAKEILDIAFKFLVSDGDEQLEQMLKDNRERISLAVQQLNEDKAPVPMTPFDNL